MSASASSSSRKEMDPKLEEDLSGDDPTSVAASSGIDTGTLTVKDLSAAQLQCVRSLQERLRDAGESASAADIDRIVRFAVARNFDVEKSADMLLKNCEWRRQTFPIRYSEVYEELKKGKFFFNGVDKEGRPVLITRSRLYDPKVRVLQQAARAILYVVERRMRQLERDRKAGKTKATQLVVIYDREGFSRANLDTELLKLIATEMSANYPEVLFKCLIYPTGWLFRSIFSVVQYFFDPKTRAKVVPLKSLGQLKDYIFEEQLMKDYGGKNIFSFDAKSLPTPEQVKGKEEEEVKLFDGQNNQSEIAENTMTIHANLSSDSNTSASITSPSRHSVDSAQPATEPISAVV